MADRYSIIFTIITFSIAIATFLLTNDSARVLSVLVIATPCPLILATPVALIGGVNSASNKRIVIKNLSVLEIIKYCKNVIFDKTGTLTLGIPKLTKIKPVGSVDQKKLIQIVEAIERNSLHPYAKSIAETLKIKRLKRLSASNVSETLGKGISGEVEGENYTIRKSNDPSNSTINIYKNSESMGYLVFEDIVKNNVKSSFKKLENQRYKTTIISGDTSERVEELINKINYKVDYKANFSPEDKLEYIKKLQKLGERVIMVGDGINDAPALAASDVGVVFSHDEYTASAEAGDVILLKNDIETVNELIKISNKTMNVALQSIYIGLGLSITGMLFASSGFIVPVVGALIQELIDVGVIFNSLRTSRIK